MVMKTCSKCNKEHPIEMFSKRTYASGKVSSQSKCKNCERSVRSKYYKPHEYMRRRFKLTEERYAELMDVEICELCGGGFDGKKCIDHSHKTEKIRGVLCNKCNTALGLVGDNVETLSRMIDYINR